MLQILYKGINYNAPLDTTGFTGNIAVDSASAYVVSLVGGRLATLHPTGVALANAANNDIFAGFIINNAAGYFFENIPALASGLVPLSVGPQGVITDQIVAGLTFTPGQPLYIGSGGNAGLVTNVQPTPGSGVNSTAFGIAGSAASASSPELTILIT
jgi:hypothetical protein